ncbi:MAG: DUF411 domain-containing protein [Lysobacter sp.]
MKTSTHLLVAALVFAVSPRAIAQGHPAGHDHAAHGAPQAADAPAIAAAPAGQALANVVVHKSPYCGCCGLWVEHMRAAGFAVEVRNVANVTPIKQRVGVPLAKGSCHTAEVDGYFLEGHVPAGDVKRLLAEKPDARGLVVPGMPKGSPGMEVPDGSVDAYSVELVANDGSTSIFAQHGE